MLKFISYKLYTSHSNKRLPLSINTTVIFVCP